MGITTIENFVSLDAIEEVDAKHQGAGLFILHDTQRPVGRQWLLTVSHAKQRAVYLDAPDYQFRFVDLASAIPTVRGVLFPEPVIEVDYTSAFAADGGKGEPGDLIVNAGIASIVALPVGGEHGFDNERVSLWATSMKVSAETGFKRWRLVVGAGSDRKALWARF